MQTKRQGLFITFEGIDGCGKFTQLCKTRNWLEDITNKTVSWSSEPNDESSPVGKHIRSILKHEIPAPEDPLAFQRMFMLDGAQDLICYVLPLLAKGRTYLMERYRLSTVAYGMAAGIPPETLITCTEEIAGPFMRWPNITLLFDLPVEIAITRRLKRDGEENLQLFEKKAGFLAKVRENYLKLVDHPKFKGTIFVINGNRPPDEVFEDIKKILAPHILATAQS